MQGLGRLKSRLQPSLSLALILQFLTTSLSASLITLPIHLKFGLPTHLLPSGLSKVIFLHGRLSFIHTICPAHLNLIILIVVTKSVSSYRRYSSSFYLISILPLHRQVHRFFLIFFSQKLQGPRHWHTKLLGTNVQHFPETQRVND